MEENGKVQLPLDMAEIIERERDNALTERTETRCERERERDDSASCWELC